jgi:uncharacterized protein (DUF362 family)
VRSVSRRVFLGTAAGALAASATSACSRPIRWRPGAFRRPATSRVAILRADSYEAALAEVILDGIKLCGLEVSGRRVVLKPNLVEFGMESPINTHPAVIAAAVDAFRTRGAREVIVAEGPGHQRDTEQILQASGLLQVIRERRVPYVDLNEDEVVPLALGSDFTRLSHLYFPATVVKSDLVVSMPKLKTHHWAGVTLSLKNMFGVIPGAVYGWPKNLLHWAGIHQSVVDINSTLPAPTFAIVDGIVGMEGNGPIQGQAKRCGVLVCGGDMVAVDATAARLMKIEPHKIAYLENAGQFLGNLAVERIVQTGLAIESVWQDFAVIDAFRDLKLR